MKFTNVPHQEWFFYDLKWTKEMDCLLLRHIIAREEECRPTPPAESPHALHCVLGSINSELGTSLRYVDVQERVAFLKGRYTTFKWITRLPKTHWDLQKNVVLAADQVWQRIFKENPFAQAYYYEGEPEYYKLCLLFGIESIKEESISKTVILISDSPRSKKEARPDITLSFSEDEVNSPVMKAPAARKLFDDDAASSIAPSNRRTGYYFVPWPAIENKMRFPPRNAFPVKPKESDGKKDGIGVSSCASSSPHP